MYCSAHTCSFALRRGAEASTLTGEHSATERAVVRVAEDLSPAEIVETVAWISVQQLLHRVDVYHAQAG